MRIVSPNSYLDSVNHWDILPNSNISAPRMSLHFWYYKNVCHITSCTSWSGKILSSDLFVRSVPSFFLTNLRVSQVLSLHEAFPGNYKPHCFFPDLTLRSQSLFFPPSDLMPFNLSSILAPVCLSSMGTRTTAFIYIFIYIFCIIVSRTSAHNLFVNNIFWFSRIKL